MGSAESREGRRASFGMDEEERVRVLQGIRLSENVVNRMKDPGQPSRVGPLDPPAAALGSSGGREKDSKPPRPECGSGQGPLRVQVDPLERCDREQAVLQHELVHVATTDREAAAKPRSVTLRRGEGSADQEKQRLAQLARELESQEAELRRRDAFCKEQLGRLERQNLETYRLSSQQFHEAAAKVEGAIKPRRVEPVCSGLQAQILRCYRDHLQEVLLCADLVRAYQHCVGSAHKARAAPPGLQG
ncbi:MICOS complex subunit MIC25 isoform X1 [Muntiacus reevesi]|uniref:MICOS complex subunit MIC25 isoform X1 n=1 Tax=Muntiacus reevesi TaxID=9886 RepID=UPI003306B43D